MEKGNRHGGEDTHGKVRGKKEEGRRIEEEKEGGGMEKCVLECGGIKEGR